MRLVFVVLCKTTGSHPSLVVEAYHKIWKFSFSFFVQKYFRGLISPQKLVFNRFYIPRFIDLEWYYTRQENMANKQVVVFVAITQLFVSYSHSEENQL